MSVAQSADAPIFVVGHPRSGTTLLRLMLSAHPRIYICHETWFYFWESLFPKDRSGDDFLRHYFQTFSFRWLNLDPEEVLEELPTSLPREDVGSALRVILERKAAVYGRPRFGDKSPPHTRFVKRILADYPDARVIYITRDPRDSVLSIARTPWGSGRELASCIGHEIMHREIKPFAGRIHTVAFEDLIADPRSVLQSVLDFVGEPWDEAVLDHSSHRLDTQDMPPLPWLASSGQPLSQPASRWHGTPPSRVRLIEMLCRGSLREYGLSAASLSIESSRLQVYMAGLAGVPDAVRYSVAWLSLLRHLKKPEHWGPMHGGGDAKGAHLLRRINPAFWDQNKGFEMPVAPALPDRFAG